MEANEFIILNGNMEAEKTFAEVKRVKPQDDYLQLVGLYGDVICIKVPANCGWVTACPVGN